MFQCLTIFSESDSSSINIVRKNKVLSFSLKKPRSKGEFQVVHIQQEVHQALLVIRLLPKYLLQTTTYIMKFQGRRNLKGLEGLVGLHQSLPDKLTLLHSGGRKMKSTTQSPPLKIFDIPAPLPLNESDVLRFVLTMYYL